MFCPDCGAANIDGAAFCLTCRRSFASGTTGAGPLPAGAPPAGAANGPATSSAYAAFGDRLVAFILDGLFAFSLGLIPSIVVGIVFGEIEYNTLPADTAGSGDTPLIVFFGMVIGLAIGVVAYQIVMGARGGGWGKQIMKIRVVRTRDGARPGYGSATGRVAAVIAIGFIPVVGNLVQLLDDLSMLWDGDHQTWHDKLAGTRVVPYER